MMRTLAVLAAAFSLYSTSRPVVAERLLSIAGNVQTQTALVSFDSSNPQLITSSVNITGLLTNDFIVAMDVRPATQQLYCATVQGRLYTLNTSTGALSRITSSLSLGQVATALSFDPITDRIRLINGSSNRTIDPTTGSILSENTPLTISGSTTFSVTGAAYTNQFPGAPSTTLYDLAASLILNSPNALFIQGSLDGNPTSPDTGILNPVGPLGLYSIFGTAFDISSQTGIAYAAITPNSAPTQLYTVDLSTGAATLLGQIGSGLRVSTVITVAPTPEPAACTVLTLGLLALLPRRHRTPE